MHNEDADNGTHQGGGQGKSGMASWKRWYRAVTVCVCVCVCIRVRQGVEGRMEPMSCARPPTLADLPL